MVQLWLSQAVCVLNSQMKTVSKYIWSTFFQLSQEKILKIMNMVKNKEVSIEGALHLAQKEVYTDKVRSLLYLFCKPFRCTSMFWKSWMNVRSMSVLLAKLQSPFVQTLQFMTKCVWLKSAAAVRLALFYPVDVSCRCCGCIHVITWMK